MSQPQNLRVTHIQERNEAIIAPVSGRLPKPQYDSIRHILRGASVVRSVSRCRRGRLKVALSGDGAIETVSELLGVHESRFEQVARREADRRSCRRINRDRANKLVLSSGEPLADDSWTQKLLEDIQFESLLSNPAAALL